MTMNDHGYPTMINLNFQDPVKSPCKYTKKGFVFNFGIGCDIHSSTLCSDRQFVSTMFTVTFSLVHQSL